MFGLPETGGLVGTTGMLGGRMADPCNLCSFMKNVYSVFSFDQNAVGFATLK